MNTKLKLKINTYSLLLSKCFYKVNCFFMGRWIGKIRQSTTLPFLEKEAKSLLEKKYSYDNLEEVKNPPVFIMWYQGFENLPEVIEKCIESIKKNIKNRPIILVSRENLHNFCDIPDYIYEKVDSGNITKTIFSDIARAALLYKNGGTWCDAAIFLTKEIPESYFDKIFYCPCGIKSELKKDFRYLFRKTQGWNISFQGSKYKNFPLYDFLFHFYCEYLSKYENHIDYFMTDFSISLFLKHNEDFYKIITEQVENNTQEFTLALMMNKTISSKTKRKLQFLEENFIHKLTYKKNWKREINGKQTVYDYVVFNNYEEK